ncbi:hypothetical protein BGX26_010033 [Mortierella sp. AD094]|nr:hypothetical protein BGX26_010033 [Mortierella sp. AD094]
MSNPTSVSAILQQQIEQLEKERKVLHTQYTRLLYANNTKKNVRDNKREEDVGGEEEKEEEDRSVDDEDDEKEDSTDERPSFLCDDIIPSYLWLQAGNSIQKFRELLLRGENTRALKVQDLLEALVRLTLLPDKEVRLAEVQRDEKVRLAEIAKEEKDRQAVIAKEEKIRLQELSNEEKMRIQELANEEKGRQADVAKDEKIRLAELAKEEKIRLAELLQHEKIRLRELSKELQEQEKNEKVRLEELKLDEIRFVEGARKDLDLRLAELMMPVKRIYATKDAAIEEHKSSERKLAAILKHIELVTTPTYRLKGKSSDDTHCSANVAEATGAPPEYAFGDVERTVQLTERLATLVGQGRMPPGIAFCHDLESEDGTGDIPN